MEAKFTHTEWRRAGTTVYALNLEGSNRFSALVQGGWATDGRLRTDDAELVANARLIAAAPELFAIVATFDSYMGHAGEDAEQDSNNPIRSLRWKAQQAIRKATTGEQA